MGIKMRFNVGDKIVSDDYRAVGILTNRGNRMVVVSDSGTFIYDEDDGADWEHYDVWLANIKRNRETQGGLLRKLFNIFK